MSGCPMCASADVERIAEELPLFRHLDFTNLCRGSRIGRCKQCQLVFALVQEDEIEEIDDIYVGEEYFQSNQTDQTKKVPEFDRPVTRSFLQADIIRRIVTEKKPSFLDIGCFNGELLKELDRAFDGAELHGFDVNEHLREIFPKKSNFHFWLSDLSSVEGAFDLISLSHSIMYFSDLNALMNEVRRMMKPGGVLYVQTPNIITSPFFILLGDQYYHFTPAILGNLFRHYGFEFSAHESDWFPREIVGVGRFNAERGAVQYTPDKQIYESMEYLKRTASELRALSAQRIGILGTTAGAAFVDSILESRETYFVDENPNRVATQFRKKPVIHPSSLTEGDTVIIPLGASSAAVRDRFSQEYRGRFVAV